MRERAGIGELEIRRELEGAFEAQMMKYIAREEQDAWECYKRKEKRDEKIKDEIERRNEQEKEE
jgi:hypothetical protein